MKDRERLLEVLHVIKASADEANYYYGESKVGPDSEGTRALAVGMHAIREALLLIGDRLIRIEDGWEPQQGGK